MVDDFGGQEKPMPPPMDLIDRPAPCFCVFVTRNHTGGGGKDTGGI